MMEIGDVPARIRTIRESQGLGITKFAREIGIPHPILSNIEAGTTKLTLNVFKAICQRFNINPLWLGFGLEPMLNKPGTLGQISADEKKALDRVQRYFDELRNYPHEEFLNRTIIPQNFPDRRPEAAVPGLLQCLTFPIVQRLQPTSSELNFLADTIEANPSLFKVATPEFFLELLKTYRQSRVESILEILDRLRAQQP